MTEKKSFGAKPIIYTLPVYIVGYQDDYNIPNIVAISWAGMVCSEPPHLSISLRKIRHSYWGIMRNRTFTVNIPSVKHIDSADFSGSISGKECNKFDATGLTPIFKEDFTAPYVDEYPINILCNLKHTLDLGTHTVFIGEIKETLVSNSVLDEKGNPILEKVNPFIYDNVSRHYFKIGEKLSLAYNSKDIFFKKEEKSE